MFIRLRFVLLWLTRMVRELGVQTETSAGGAAVKINKLRRQGLSGSV